MDKLKYVKLENPDGSYSDSIPLAVDSDYVDVNGSSLTAALGNKADMSVVNSNIANLQSEISGLASGGPAGVYETVSALTTADPNHNKIYIVTENGHWYYYNEGWQDGGIYQATGVNKNDPVIKNIQTSIDILDVTDVVDTKEVEYDRGFGKFWISYTSHKPAKIWNDSLYGFYTAFIPCPSDTIITYSGCGDWSCSAVTYYDQTFNFISAVQTDSSTQFKETTTFTAPQNSAYCRISGYDWGQNRRFHFSMSNGFISKKVNSEIDDIKSRLDNVENEFDTIIDKDKAINVFSGTMETGIVEDNNNGGINSGSGVKNYACTSLFFLDAGDYVYKVKSPDSWSSADPRYAGLMYIQDSETKHHGVYNTVLGTVIEQDLEYAFYRIHLDVGANVRVNMSFPKTSSLAQHFMIVQGTEISDYPNTYTPYYETKYLTGEDVYLGDTAKNQVEEMLEDVTNEAEITIANSGKIGFFSNSFLNGYTMLGKHPVNYLGAWSDYIMYNFSHSGDDFLECLSKVNSNQTWLGTVPVTEWGLTYAVLAMQDNDGALFAANKNTYYENIKKLAYAVRSCGAIPVFGTEHDRTLNYYGLQRAANDFGGMLMNWGSRADAVKWNSFRPFNYNYHPSTRTHWVWTFGMKEFLDSLPRPKQGIKLFRRRSSYANADISSLIFNDVYERSKRFEEIYNGSEVFTANTEKNFDKLYPISNVSTRPQYDEYQAIQSQSGTVSFGDTMMTEIITPYDANHIKKLKINIDATGIEHCYIKKNNMLSNPLPATRYIAFGVTEGASLLTPGTTFSITGGTFSDTLLGNYTVEKVINNVVVTTTNSSGKTTSGTDIPVCSIDGVEMAGSYDYPSAAYMERYTEPLGEFVEVSIVDGTITISDFLNYMDFDKICLLMTGTNITLTDISAICSGDTEKILTNLPRVIRKEGTELLTNTLFNQNTGWDGYDNLQNVSKITDGTYTESFPTGITTVKKILEGNSISQTFENPGDSYNSPRVQIRVLMRNFPKYVSNDTDWATSELTEGSYDCGTVSIAIDGVKVAQVETGNWWYDYPIETDIFRSNTPITLTITAENKDVQIAKVEVIDIGIDG